ncbi:TraB/GumN family protein [Fusibacter bizertensis]
MKKTKKMIAMIMMVAILISTITPVWADEQQTMDVSSWAVSKLNEGEKFGIYPMTWYYENFKDTITQEKLTELLKQVDLKLDVVADKVDFEAITVDDQMTRGNILAQYYNLLGAYGLVTKGDAMTFMQSNGIVSGTFSGLNLDRPCNTEQAILFGINTIQFAYAKLEAGGKGVFWKVEKGGNTVYLLGSVHVGSTDQYPLNTMLTDAFDASDALLVEADLLNQAGGMDYFRSKAFYTDGTTIESHISKELYDKLINVLEKYNLDPSVYTTLKPWSLANELNVVSMSNTDQTEGATEGANLGIDVYFTVKSYLTEKPVYELEGIPYQTDLFDNLTPEFQETYLTAVVDGILAPATGEATDSSKLLDEWLTYWIQGNLDKFTTSFNASSEEESTELTDMLFGKRDQDMAEKIKNILEQEGSTTYFVVVGAGHFINPTNIIKTLEADGYTVDWMY